MAASGKMQQGSGWQSSSRSSPSQTRAGRPVTHLVCCCAASLWQGSGCGLGLRRVRGSRRRGCPGRGCSVLELHLRALQRGLGYLGPFLLPLTPDARALQAGLPGWQVLGAPAQVQHSSTASNKRQVPHNMTQQVTKRHLGVVGARRRPLHVPRLEQLWQHVHGRARQHRFPLQKRCNPCQELRAPQWGIQCRPGRGTAPVGRRLNAPVSLGSRCPPARRQPPKRRPLKQLVMASDCQTLLKSRCKLCTTGAGA